MFSNKRAAVILRLGLIIVLGGLYWSYPQSARADTIYKSGHITSNETWTAGNVYVIQGHVTVDSGVALTIQGGAIVKFAGSKLLGVNGVLKVQGTAANPVYITSLKDDTVGGDTNGDGNATAPAAGDWGHIVFLDSSVDSENIIEYATIRYGGYFNDDCGSYCSVYYGTRSVYYGAVRFHSASPTVRNSTLTNNSKYALSASVDSFPVISGNTLTFNQGNGLEIRGSTLSAASPIIRHWSNTDVVYAVTGNTTVGSGVTLVIDPGVTVKFAANTLLGVNGVLKVQGTIANPVTITSLRDDTAGGDTNGDGNTTAPAAGDWRHIWFSNPAAHSDLQYAVVRYGGNGGYMLRCDGAYSTLQHVLVEYSSGDGLYIYHANDDPGVTIQYCTFRLNNGSGVHVVGP